MKELLGKIAGVLLSLPIIYIVIMATFNGCVTRTYHRDEPHIYRYVDKESNFIHCVLLKGSKAAIYRGAISGTYGEYALQRVTLDKWQWYFPHVYVRQRSFFIFGLRIMTEDCIPTTMEWGTVYNETIGGCEAAYTDRSWNYVDVKFYEKRVRFGDMDYEICDDWNGPIAKKLRQLVNSNLEN